MVEVRAATAMDMPAILEMGARFYASTEYTAIAPYCYGSAALLGQLLLDTGVVLVAEREGQLLGVVGLSLVPFLFNRSVITAHEVMWWVDEEHRDSGAGVALLRAIEPACRAKGASAIQMLHLATSPRQAGVLYRRLGFSLSETLYFKVL